MLKNLIYNIASKGLVFISQFVVLILTNHIIGPEGRGIFIAAITWSSTFFVLSHLSLSTGILNLSNKSKDYVNKLAVTSALAALILGLISILAGLSSYLIIPSVFNNLNIKLLALAFATIPFMMLQQYTMAIVQVKGDFKAFNILYTSYAILNLAGVSVIWLIDSTSVDLLIYVNLAAWILTGAIAFAFLYPNFKNWRIGDSIFKLFAKTSISAHIGAIVTFAVSRSDILIVNYYTDEKQTGIYGLAVGIVQILLIIPLAVQNLLYHALLGKEKEEQKTILLQNSRLTFNIMLLAATSVFFLANPLVGLVGGKGFEDAVPLFKYFLPAIVLYAIPMVLATQWNILGIFKKINTWATVGLLLSLAGNLILVPMIGIRGGAITFLIVAFFSICVHIWFVQKYLGKTSIIDILVLRQSDIKLLFKK